MIKIKNVKMIEVGDWDELVTKTYGKPYSFQQQDDCQDRGTVKITIPSEYTGDEEMNDDLEFEINGEEMGVKFETWLKTTPEEINAKHPEDYKGANNLWWDRNFYPDLYTVANDLHAKGLIEAGDYTINIDW